MVALSSSRADLQGPRLGLHVPTVRSRETSCVRLADLRPPSPIAMALRCA